MSEDDAEGSDSGHLAALAGTFGDTNQAEPADAAELAADAHSVADGLNTAAGELAPDQSGLGRLARSGGRLLGALGLPFAGADVLNGLQQIHEGDLVNGVADTTSGGAGIVAGAAALVGGAAAVPIAAGASAVVAGIDGITTLADGINNNDPLQATAGAVKTAGAGLLLAGAVTVNPLLIGAGALTYVGGVALEHAPAIAEAVNAGLDVAGDAVNAGLDVAGDAVNAGLDVAGDAVNAGLDVAADAVNAGLDVAGDAVDAGLDVAGEAVNAGLDVAEDAVNAGLDVVGDAANQLFGAVGNFLSF